MNALTKSFKALMVASVVIISLSVTSIAFAEPGNSRDKARDYGGMMGNNNYYSPNMMGNSFAGDCTTGPGMMGQGMMGQGMMGGGMMGNGMMGNPNGYYGFPGGERITIEEVEESLQEYIRYNRMTGIEVAEVMEFERNYYAQLQESDTEIGAVEVLINPYTGFVSAEPGPNMMWNTKYGHMRGWNWGSDQEMKVNEKEAVEKAQEYLDYYNTDFAADDHADEFYGYYTLHVLDEEEIVGMLSVNGLDGSVWYHDWHGDFVGMDSNDHD